MWRITPGLQLSWLSYPEMLVVWQLGVRLLVGKQRRWLQTNNSMHMRSSSSSRQEAPLPKPLRPCNQQHMEQQLLQGPHMLLPT